jgi:hypothetical protein
MPEMEERLLLLPRTLEGYFRSILDKVHQQYRRFTAQVLLLSINEDRGRLTLETTYFLWLLVNKGAILIQQQQPWKPPQSWQSDIRLRIWKACGDFLDTRTDSVSPYVSHVHPSVADFLRLPEIRSQLLLHAGWQESDI